MKIAKKHMDNKRKPTCGVEYLVLLIHVEGESVGKVVGIARVSSLVDHEIDGHKTLAFDFSGHNARDGLERLVSFIPNKLPTKTTILISAKERPKRPREA